MYFVTGNETASNKELRAALTDAVEAGRLYDAIGAAQQLLNTAPAMRTYVAVRNAFARASASLGLRPVKVALLSSFTIDHVHQPLQALGYLDGLDITIQQSGFDQYQQEILNPGSALYAFEAELVVLAIESHRWLPQSEAISPRSDATKRDVDAALGEVQSLVRNFRSKSNAMLLIHNACRPRFPKLGVMDASHPAAERVRSGQFNQGLAEICEQFPGVHVLDYEALVSRRGWEHWHDARMAHYAKAPIALSYLPDLANEYLIYLRALTGKTRKALVLDLDNTLWGGILGEDGVEGIVLGPDYPGSAFLEFQHAVKTLQQRGVIVALASKNNPADVREAFEQHPHMQFGLEDFACTKIGWQPKSESLRAIAAELNIGLEHIVFVDDNPAECAEVGAALPMVTIVNLRGPPESYLQQLFERSLFDTLSLSTEDQNRAELYRQRAEAEKLREEAATDLEGFYRKLEMQVHAAPVDATSLARASQMTQKTNQFNVTTRRYSESEVMSRVEDPDWSVMTVAVKDRFGDNGIVGLMMLERQGDALAVDTLLMSCRVIGRTVESAMLHLATRRARELGVTRIIGKVILTAKNAPARSLYADHGFTQIHGEDENTTLWAYDLNVLPDIPCPQWLALT